MKFSPTILAFLSTQTLGVVSTLGADGEPQSATVAFSESPDGTIVFGTFDDSRKFANILRDPRVSLVVSDDDHTVQVQGVARLTEGEDAARCRARHAAKNPSTEKFADDPRQRYFLVTPTWLRFTDYTTEPESIEERMF